LSVSSAVKGKHEGSGEIARFYMVFVPCLIAFGIVYLMLRTNPVLDPFLEFNAGIVSAALSLFGVSSEVSGATVISSMFSFYVIAECTSLLFTGIFISAVLAWPATKKRKLNGIAIGVAGLFLLNLIRMITLFYIGSSMEGLFDIIHFFVWPIVMVVVTIGLWLFWTK